MRVCECLQCWAVPLTLRRRQGGPWDRLLKSRGTDSVSAKAEPGPKGAGQDERAAVLLRIESLRRQGICYICRDLETHEVFGKQPVIFEDDVYRVVLDSFPLNPGHTIVTFKPHRENLASLAAEDAARIFKAVVRISRAIQAGLGADAVYLLAMPDGSPSHLTFQLVPRYAGQPMGTQLLRMKRGRLKNGEKIARRIIAALKSPTQ